MGSAVWGRNRKNHEDWIPAGERWVSVLRQRCSSSRGFAVGFAATNCVLVPEVDQRATEDDAAAKTETDGTRTRAEIAYTSELGRVRCEGTLDDNCTKRSQLGVCHAGGLGEELGMGIAIDRSDRGDPRPGPRAPQ